ncbi:MAG: lipopolysaccharide biosynthesis protein RfbH [Candidatus Roizmanbacteria bacterium]|nr:lipopolysaccharide biosynthesis protein RfbH [Candidatus Roizmanbacteria bacterium]
MKFIPGKTYIPVSGKVFDKEEINNAIKVARDGWWTEGEFSKLFEKDFKNYLDVKFVSLVNSGSSANLVALYSLTSSVFGDRALKAGDEFITTSVAFPTTVNPGVMLGMKPIFIDAELDTLNIDANKIEKAITKKTKLIMVAHTLGRPFDLAKIVDLCKKYNLWLIEDCCDALGSKYEGKMLGTFGDIATYSFYPAHQITMGEGGAIVTNNSLIHRSIRQFRDWGRDCWCDTGKDDTCRKRFQWKMGDLPFGYDHKYIYTQVGFNLKLTDFQAAIGVAQLKKLPGFIKKRQENYRSLYTFFSQYSQYFQLMEENSMNDISYFGFPLIVKAKAPFTRNELTEYLEKNKIGTRNIFSGNLLRHPAYIGIKAKIKVIGDHKNADLIMNNALWLGVYSGIDKKRLEYIKMILTHFLIKKRK